MALSTGEGARTLLTANYVLTRTVCGLLQVYKLANGAHSKRIKRDDWAFQLTMWIVEGVMSRGHLNMLISAEVLRDVGFSASELLATGFTLPVLRDGGFLAAELRKVGLKASDLAKAGYTPQQLKQGGYTAKNLKDSGFSAAQIKQGGFSVKVLKQVGFSAAELKQNGCSCAELREGTFSAADLKPLDYTVPASASPLPSPRPPPSPATPLRCAVACCAVPSPAALCRRLLRCAVACPIWLPSPPSPRHLLPFCVTNVNRRPSPTPAHHHHAGGDTTSSGIRRQGAAPRRLQADRAQGGGLQRDGDQGRRLRLLGHALGGPWSPRAMEPSAIDGGF